jgi:hypothetical protein
MVSMTLDEFVEAACAALGLDPQEVPRDMVLELARDVAHNTVRPAAPISTFLLGLAVGKGAALAESAARLTAVAQP